MKDTTTALIIGLILGIIIGAFAGYQYSERRHDDCIRINIGSK
jgi:ABC-type dipeptide/oligopeptide/nickel transport system permease subunit